MNTLRWEADSRSWLRLALLVAAGVLIVLALVFAGGGWDVAYGQTAGPAPTTLGAPGSGNDAPPALPEGTAAAGAAFQFTEAGEVSVLPDQMGAPAGTDASKLSLWAYTGTEWTKVDATFNSETKTFTFEAKPGYKYVFVLSSSSVTEVATLPQTGSPEPASPLPVILGAGGIVLAIVSLAGLRRRTA
ncbi:MAG: hypothetical protein M1319_01580 [Chloroflexi bacterium]|nr:hypothetical protein [Chloroflexota bacterium]